MLKTTKAILLLFKKDINTRLLKIWVKRKQRDRYLNLWQRRELIFTERLMKNLEQQRRQRSI